MRSEILLKRRERVHRLMMLSYKEHKYERTSKAQGIIRVIDMQLNGTNVR
jgi:hypothetical protein